MSRDLTQKLSKEWLDTLVPAYAVNKAQADKYKKAAEDDNKNIKRVMAEHNLDTYTAGDITVTRTVSNRESMDQDKLLQVALKHKLPVVRTVEIVDMAALENYLYNNAVSYEVQADLAACKTSQEVVTLRIKGGK